MKFQAKHLFEIENDFLYTGYHVINYFVRCFCFVQK